MRSTRTPFPSPSAATARRSRFRGPTSRGRARPSPPPPAGRATTGARTARRPGAGRRRAPGRPRRHGRPLCPLARRGLRHVLRRRRRLGRAPGEGGALRGRAGAARRAARPDRPVVPLRRDPDAARRHRVRHRAAGGIGHGGRRRGVPQADPRRPGADRRPERAGHPLPDEGPTLAWPPAGLELEVAARASHGLPRLVERAGRFAYTFFVWTCSSSISGSPASRPAATGANSPPTPISASSTTGSS
jgi:hypothetical protein